MTVKPLLLLFLPIALVACGSTPRDAFRMKESALAVREMQTREYLDVSDAIVLSASAGLLQDMGYAIDEIEEPLGVLSASKRADATNRLEFMGAVVLESFKCVFTFDCKRRNANEIGDYQDIYMTIVTRPKLGNEKDVVVRVTIQRVIWDKKGQISHQGPVGDGDVYLSFFDKMSKAVFLEREGV
jgi:hypothetical protein